MPSIRITDELGANLDVELQNASTWITYVRKIPDILLHGGSIQSLGLFTLREPAATNFQPTLNFERPVSLGQGLPALTIRAEAGAGFRVVARTEGRTALFPHDDYGENIEIAPGRCYAAVGFRAAAGVGLEAGTEPLQFGIDAGSELGIETWREFSAGADAPTIVEALRRLIGEFVIPASAEDFQALPEGAIVTVTGTGTLKFSGDANLLAVANPLAALALPSPLPALSLKQGASVAIGATWEISSEYQVRVRKTGPAAVRLGWYRKHGSELNVRASVSAGVSAGPGNLDLLPTVLSAVSSNAAADLAELRAAGLDDARARDFQEALECAVNRKLELSLAAEFGSLGRDEAAFLYDVDLGALDDAGRQAIRRAIAGNLTDLAGADALPSGITAVRSIFSRLRQSQWSLKLNLLGIFNYGSISRLALNGTVTYTPSTGEVVIADTATASRFTSTTLNFGADEEKLRHVMAESFLITAAYRTGGAVASPPELASSHLFFRMDAHAGRNDVRRAVAAASALGLHAVPPPADADDFGRTSVLAQARYDDALSHALFLGADGSPRPAADYEAAGRRAIRALVLPDADDAFRLRPVTDDSLWARMKDLGPANFEQLFSKAHAAGIRPDYLAIQWWTEAMCGAADVLFRMRRDGAAALRGELAEHLRSVAARAHEQFGTPWGLVAMFLVSGEAAETEAQIAGPKFAFAARKALRAAV